MFLLFAVCSVSRNELPLCANLYHCVCYLGRTSSATIRGASAHLLLTAGRSRGANAKLRAPSHFPTAKFLRSARATSRTETLLFPMTGLSPGAKRARRLTRALVASHAKRTLICASMTSQNETGSSRTTPIAAPQVLLLDEATN